MELAAGTLVTENVRLVEPLGVGGMGSVWAAEHLGLRTRVAVKFVAQELLDEDPDMLKRFRREAGAAARIKSPHVVQTLDHGVTPDGTPYIVMELLEGESLAQRLERSGTLPLPHIVEITEQVARGLGKAHAVGIVHRDIKPDNVFLMGGEDDELFVKLLDFGVAKHIGLQSHSVVTGTGAMIGTPGYMSPEQVLTGKHVDLRSDLWSLAVVVYHAMIGDIPFRGDTFGALCVSITRGEHVPPSKLRADVPLQVDAWMARALALDPQERFQSAKELASALRGAVEARTGAELASTVVLGADALPTVQRPSPLYQGARASGAHGTVLMASAEAHDMPALALDEPETRQRDRARPNRARWLVAGVVALLGFLTGFLIVLVARPKRAMEAVAPPAAASLAPPTAAPDESAPEESAPQASAPPPEPQLTPIPIPNKAAKQTQVAPRPPASTTPIMPPVDSRPKDRGF